MQGVTCSTKGPRIGQDNCILISAFISIGFPLYLSLSIFRWKDIKVVTRDIIPSRPSAFWSQLTFLCLDDQKVTAMILINLSKALAGIFHSIPLKKLQVLGTSTNALNWLQSYLTGREQITRVGISISAPLFVDHGVPKRSILRPVLFSLNVYK